MSVVKSGYVKRHSKSLFHGGWKDTWVELFDNSDLCLHKHQHDSELKARIHLRDVCKRFAYGQYTNGFPDRPDLPDGASIDSLLAIPTRNNSKCKVFWLLCHDPNELHEWMNAICKTLPPPPSPQEQPSNPPPSYNAGAPGGIGFDGVSGGYYGGPAPHPQQPGPYPPGPPPQGYPQQPYQQYPQYQQQPYGQPQQQQHHEKGGILGGLGGILGGKGGHGGHGGGILGSKAGKVAAGLAGGAALGYGAKKMLGHGWGMGSFGSWGSMSSFGSAGSFGSIGSFD